jgi:HSP20 family molecular chaperone IbpA
MKQARRNSAMSAISRWEHFRGLNTLQEQVNRLFEDGFGRSGQGELTSWAPAVDIYETESDLVVKADLPDLDEKDIEIRVENNTLTIRGERKFEQSVNKTTTCEWSEPTDLSAAASRSRIQSTPKASRQIIATAF